MRLLLILILLPINCYADVTLNEHQAYVIQQFIKQQEQQIKEEHKNAENWKDKYNKAMDCVYKQSKLGLPVLVCFGATEE